MLDAFAAVAEQADAATGAGVLEQLASNADSLKDSTVRGKLENLTDSILATAVAEGVDADTGAQLLNTISSSTAAGKAVNDTGSAQATKVAARVQQVALVSCM